MAQAVKRLYKNLKPEHYDLQLDINEAAMTFSGSVTILARLTSRPSRRITLHQKDLKITHVELYRVEKSGEHKIPHTRINLHKTYDEVRIHTDNLLYAGTYRIVLNFSGAITKPMDGLYPSMYEEAGKTYTIFATQFESHHARQVLPCIDEPEAKATFKLTLTDAKDSTTLSNTEVIEQHVHGDRKTTFFDVTPVMSTYLLAFVSGRLEHLHAKTKQGVIVRTYATPHNAPHTKFALETAVRCLEFYEEYFDIPYPLQSCNLIALPDFASGAMENWGCITFREQCLIVDDLHTSLPSKQYVALVVAHELAHQWFGNLVTMRWWTDLWLNEGFASWIEYLVCDKLFPEWQLWTQFLVDEKEPALKLDALENTHPIEVPVRHPDEIRTIFDAISYNKGASVINMLHGYLGETVFRDGLRHYLKKHSYNNTDTVDLWAALEHVSKQPVKAFMHAWTSQPGFPLVTVHHEHQKVTISQKRFSVLPLSKAATHDTWPVPLLRLEGNSLSEIIRESSAEFEPQEVNLLNRGQSGFYRTAYDPESLRVIGELVRSDSLHERERIGVLSDTFESAKVGGVSTVEALTFMEYYAEESSVSVWDIISMSLGSIRAVMDDEQLREQMKPFSRTLIANQLNRLGWNKHPHESHNDTLLRPTILGMASVADEPTVVAHALELFDKLHTANDLSPSMQEVDQKIRRAIDIDPDLRGIVYGTVARNRGAEDFEKLLRMHNLHTNSEQRNTIAAALTGFKQPELIERALSIITTDQVRLQDVAYWIAYSFMNRYARRATWEWLISHWSWLEKNFDGDLGFYRTPIYAARAFSTSDFLDDYLAFFADKRTPAFQRSIDQGEEIIRWHSAWRERDLSATKKYFTSGSK